MYREAAAIVLVGVLGYALIEAQANGFCTFEGKYYQSGTSWYVNCSSLCTCWNTLAVTCKNPCLDFSNLPAGCYLTAPPQGRCCPQPYCTDPSIYIDIPQEYRGEYPNVHNNPHVVG